MPTIGALNNTNVANGRIGNYGHFSELTMPEAGTLTSFHIYIEEYFSNPNYRCAVYQGGTAGEIGGSSLIWDSGEQTAPASAAWVTLTAGGESLAATRTWLVVVLDGSTQIWDVDDPDYGDLEVGMWWYGGWSDTTAAFPSTAPDKSGTVNAFYSLKAFITYGTGGGGIPAAVLLNSNQFA